MSRRNKKSIMGWLLMGLIAVVAAVFRDSWLPHVKKIPLVKDGIEKLEENA